MPNMLSSSPAMSSLSLLTPPFVGDANSAKISQECAAAKQRKSTADSDTSDRCWKVLTETFGHSEYKGKQKEIVEAAVQGADVFVLAPTGMGKSICFQIPALADCGVTVVVSPLLALMKNQVAKLRRVDVAVVAFTSETSRDDKQDLIEDISSEHPSTRILYISPEKFCASEFNKLLSKLYDNGELNRLVVDEAHCISEWGHDFRSEYRRLGSFRDRFPNIPIMALTATATPAVQDDIIRSLGMSEDNLFKVVHPFNRANLFYEVRYLSSPDPDSHMADVFDYISNLHRRRGRPSSGIVYCRTRARCDSLSAYLRGKGLNARPYHRGIKPSILDKTLAEWEQGGAGDGGVDVVCATIAFGMGIDKADVRYILHYDLPKSFEGYYQETGRGGRDGSPSKCILFYSREDVIRVRKWVSGSHAKRLERAESLEGPMPSQRAVDSLTALINYAESVYTCRHVSICRYFGERIDSKNSETMKRYCDGMCDICKYPEKTRRRKSDLSSEDLVSTQTATLQRQADIDVDEDQPRRVHPPVVKKPAGPAPAVNHSTNSGWKKTLRHGDEDDAAVASDATVDEPLNRRSSFTRSNFTTSNSIEAGPKKRPASTLGPARGENKNTKKAKGAYSAPLLAMSSRLKQTINKPFRSPFISPAHQPLREQQQNISAVLDVPTDEAEDNDIMEVFSSIEPEDVGHIPQTNNEDFETMMPRGCPSSPISLPDTDIELDASYSQKIPVPLRMETFTSLRRALHKAFSEDDVGSLLWKRVDKSNPDTDYRGKILATVARELEFTVTSLCTTQDGYTVRSRGQIEAVKMLSRPEAWNDDGASDFEDAREVVGTLKRTSAAVRRKGKGKDRA